MRRILSAAALVAALSVIATAADTAPKLVVVLVVDQMRADYVERFKGDWTGGLKRLVTEGAWFTRAAYPYLLTITCPGHATISTGTFPSTHGVFSNQWWDRESGRQMQCSDDPSATNFGYDGPGKDHNSGYRLKVQTFADRLMQHRIRRARRMLESPAFDRVTTAEIGRRVGLLDPSHFIRVCRRLSGCTPQELRLRRG